MPTVALLACVALLALAPRCRGYLVVVTEELAAVGDDVFYAGVPLLGDRRAYALSEHRTASFASRLLSVDPVTGAVSLRQPMACDGLRHPTLFTAHIESRSGAAAGVDFVSVPVRMFVAGERCRSNDHHDQVHERLWAARSWPSETHVSFGLPSAEPAQSAVCLRRSAQVANLRKLLPRGVAAACAVEFVDVSDTRFVVEPLGGDLVAASDTCIEEPVWTVSVTLRTDCQPGQTKWHRPDRSEGHESGAAEEGHFNGIEGQGREGSEGECRGEEGQCGGKGAELASTEHRIRIVFHHRALNDSDVAHRVRRELRASSPYFDQALYTASVMEELKPGSPVATLRARDPDGAALSYSMASLLDARSQAAFAIDAKSGAVTTSAKLDRETVDVHYFHVVAAADSFPPRSATTTLQVNVLDANDHAPEFEQRSYDATVRESASVGSPVVGVRATDQDIARNAEIEYVLANQTASLDGGEAFRIDGKTGAVTTRTALDREQTQTFELVVLAIDQAKPISERRTATATINVRVADDNDNYPQFSERTYSVDVPEDVDWTKSPVIATISATDKDEGANAALRYAIVSGNTQSQFSMDASSGQVSLVKPLDFEINRRFRLVVRAQDGGSPARSNTTQLLVNVGDVNDNAPRFYTSLFQETVSENVPPGFSIVRVQAYDPDDGANADVRYALGPRDEMGGDTAEIPLAVDPRTGWLKTTRELDREHRARYQLQVVASDGGDPPRQASASVVVTVADVNDNDPVFSPRDYEAAVSESASPGTPVATVTASDRDENARITYEIAAGNARGRFAISTHGNRGLVTIAQPLDYKQEKRFVLTVTATDSGRRTDTAVLTVNVTDANNFAPSFENAPYAASVFEDAAVGTTVVVVEATDGDVGQNAHITYSLGLADEPPSPDFEINAVTGAITLLRPLDREATASYLLTVTARDGGVPSLADTTDVEVTVADVNDSPPVFRLEHYMASVPEDALVGTSVLQVAATDGDVGLNGRIRFALRDSDGSFAVDPTSGVVRTAKALDRESVARVMLTALAIDRGSPALTGSAEIVIDVEDVNDSPPAFPSERITLYIAENSPPGSTVGTILAHDPDQGANAVVTYSIIGGEDSTAFSLVTRPGQPGAELLTMTELDFESPRKRFELVVRASSAPLRADARVEVVVTDVNDNAPKLKDFQVVFNNFRSCFPTGAFGRVPASDADVTDSLRFRILSGNNADLVTLNETSGALTLSPRLDTNVPKTAVMEVSVTDGVNEAKAMMTLTVRLVTDEMLFNSVTVRLADMTEKAFLSPLLGYFVDGLAAILPCPRDNIYVFSVQDDTDVGTRILNVSFSARRPELTGSEFYPPSFLQERVYLNRAILARLATVQVLPFDDNLCVREPCLNFEQCLTVLKFGNASGFVASDTVLFRPIYPVTTFACRCPHGFTGNREHYLCDTEVNLCYSSPCGREGRCERTEGGYVCVCRPGFTGRHCEIDVKLDTCQPDICRSGSACSPLVRGGFRCEGCDVSAGSEHFTPLCELRARSFDRQAFLTFPSLRQRHRLHIKLRFSTLSRYGLLLYNGRYNERHDFVALEIVDGDVHFSFSLGSEVTTTTARLEGGVSDGQWHTVIVSYFNKTAEVSLDGCDAALALPHGTALGPRWSCAGTNAATLHPRCGQLTETCHRYLDLTGPLQLGGLPRLPTAFQVHTKEFVGCMADVYIDHALLDLNSFVADNGSVAGCPARTDFCASAPCANGGVCSNGWGSFVCACPETFAGKDCSETIARPWRFQGDGSLSFNPLLRPIQLPWTNALSVRTLQRDAFLMSIQIGQNASVSLTLAGGEAVYTVGGESLRLSHAAVADGAWHHVSATWAGAELTLSLDYGRRVSMTPVAKLQGLYVGKILIGGPDADANAMGSEYDYLDGCVQDVRVGSATASLSRPTVRDNVSDGCVSADQCGAANGECPVHADCVSRWEHAECRCRAGHVGATCVDACSLEPCKNGGRCEPTVSDPRGYVCRCGNLTSGPNCAVVADTVCPAAWWGAPVCGPCRCEVAKGYAADCSRTNGTCVCQEDHFQSVPDGECRACRCYATGSLAPGCDRETGQCRCRDGVIGQRCDACANPYAEVTLRGCEVIYDGCPRSFSAGRWWRRAAFDSTATEPCPPGSVGMAARRCSATEGWLEPRLFNCTSDGFIGLRKVLSELETQTLSLGTFVAVKVATDLRAATEAQPDLRGADLLVTQRLLREILGHEVGQVGLNLTHSRDKDFVGNLVAAVSAVMQDKYDGLWETVTSLTGATAASLVTALRRYLVVLAASQQDTYTRPFESVYPNAALGLDVVSAESLFGFEPLGSRTGETVVLPDTTSFLLDQQSVPMLAFPKYDNYLSRRDKFDPWSRVLVPLSLLKLSPPAKGQVSQRVSPTATSVAAAVAYVQLRADTFPRRYDETVARRWGVELRVGAPVMALAIHAPQAEDNNEGVLAQPVLLRLWLNEELAPLSARLNPQCVHWVQGAEEGPNAQGGGWSREGCVTHLPESWLPSVTQPLLVNCTCQTLGVFTVLVDQIDAQYIPEPGPWEALATYLSFGLALPALALTWLALASLRGLDTNSNAIHKNTVLCVFLAQLAFFVALVSRKHSTLMEFPCRLLAMALHYLWLAAFSWFAVDAMHLRRMLTEVRDVNHGPMRFYYTVGYGLPAIVVGLAVAVRADQYGNFYFCWLSLYESVVWALVGPAVVLMLAALAALASCVSAAFTLKEHVLGFGSLRTLLWIAVAWLPLTGVVWVLAALSVSEPDPLLSLALSAATLLHAVFTLVGHLVLNDRVRARLRRAALRMMGRKTPPEDAVSCAGSVSAAASRSALAYRGTAALASMRRHAGISASSTTSRSTKTGSSPYRSDNHLRHTSTSTSNCTSEPVGGRLSSRHHKNTPSGGPRRDSDSDSEVSVDGRSLELASSHSSDDDESSARRRIPPRLHSVGVSTAPSYLPNIREDASSPPAPRGPGRQPGLALVSKSQLFPNLQPVFAPRWSRQLPESCLPPSMTGGGDDGSRWSGTASDNEDGAKAVAARENFLLRGDGCGDMAGDGRGNGNKLHDKYLFPFTAEEDHNALNREAGSREDVWLASLRAASPSPLLYPGSVLPTSPPQTDSEKDTSETPV